MSRRLSILLSVLIAMLAIGIWPGPGLLLRCRIWHHEDQLRLAKDEFRFGKVPRLSVVDRLLEYLSVANPRPPSWEREEFHRQQLVELGALESHEFRLMHLQTGWGAHREGRHFIRTVMSSKGPPCEDASSVYPDRPVQIVLKVWCKPGGMEAWREFIKEYDVPNYWEIRDQSVQISELASDEM